MDKKYIIISLVIIVIAILVACIVMVTSSNGDGLSNPLEETRNFTISDITPYSIDGLISQNIVSAETTEWLGNLTNSSEDYRVYETMDGDYLIVSSKDQVNMPEINPYVGSTDSEGNWHNSIVSCVIVEKHSGSSDGYGNVYLVKDCKVVGDSVS